MKQNVKMALVQLVFLIKAHANRKCTCIPGAVYTSTPVDLPDPLFQFFEANYTLIIFYMKWMTYTHLEQSVNYLLLPHHSQS